MTHIAVTVTFMMAAVALSLFVTRRHKRTKS